MKLFDSTLNALERALDVRLARQNVIAGNVANIDTPGFHPRELDFAKAMEAVAVSSPVDVPRPADAPSVEGHISVGTTHARGLSAEQLVSSSSYTREGSLDGNGVDLDTMMVELSRNGLMYGAAARAAGKKLAILRYVATDGVG